MSAPKFHLPSEEAVLGACMIDGTAYDRTNLVPEDFFKPTHQRIWQAIQSLSAAKESVDPVSTTEWLEKMDVASPREGWIEVLARLSGETPSAANVATYSDTVRRYSIQRKAIAVGKRLESLEDISEVDQVIQQLIRITSTKQNHSCHVYDAMTSMLDTLEQAGKCISTGMKDLDNAIGGFYDDDLIVVGARPACGKTAFMLNLALSSTKPVGIISGEQGRDQIGMRMVAIDTEVSLHHMRTNNLSDVEWARIMEAFTRAKQKPIWIYDKPGPTIDEVVQRARQWKYENDIGILMIDYLQKINGGDGKDFRLQIGNIASRLKNLAKELHIPVVVLAQVSRELERRPLGNDMMGRMPYAADLAESAIIENEADLIMTLYRPEVYTDLPQYKGLAYVNTCKNRHGPTGYEMVSWRGEYLKFGDLARQEDLSMPERWNDQPNKSLDFGNTLR